MRFGGEVTLKQRTRLWRPFVSVGILACILDLHTVSAAIEVSLEATNNACRVVSLPRWRGIPPEWNGGKLVAEWPDSNCYFSATWDIRGMERGILVGQSAELKGNATCTATERRISHPHKYVIDLDRGVVLRATEDEWANSRPDEGIPVVLRAPGVPEIAEDPPKRGPVIFRGKEFPKTGEDWPVRQGSAANISRDGHYIAVNSWEGGTRQVTSFIGGNREAITTNGNIHIDAYDTISGAPLFSLKAHFRHEDQIASVFRYTGWIANRYYILAIDRDHRNQFVVCDAQRVFPGKQGDWKTMKLVKKSGK